jgi:hypothetical protein
MTNKNVNRVYEQDPYNSRQNFLYKRAIFGLAAYSSQETLEMSKVKVKRINKINRKTQVVLNLWKQELVNSWTNKFFSIIFPTSPFAKEFTTCTAVDKNFICTLSFKDLNISKSDIINKLIVEKILPKEFYQLKSDVTCK